MKKQSITYSLSLTVAVTLVAALPATAQDNDPHAHHVAAVRHSNYTREIRTVEVPKVRLVNQQARRVDLADLIGPDQAVILNFIFTTCPSICPVLSATMSATQDELGDQLDRLRMVSISVDPEYDTPAVLQQYAELHDAGPQWHFLTGPIADIVTVQRAFDAYRGNKMNHAALTYIRAPGSDSWVRLDGFPRPTDLANEYRTAIAE